MSKRGRPREFDRDEAVTTAMHLFWEHGFESTSLAQLKAAIGGGISAPSFYAAFGSKEALYEEALERYLQLYGHVTRSLWDPAIAPRDAVSLALLRSARMHGEAGHPKGCMVALGSLDAGVSRSDAIAQRMRDVRSRTRAGLRACVERGIASGELRASTHPTALATALDGFFLGLALLARDGVRPPTLEKAVAAAMGIWDAAVDRPPAGD